MGEAMLLGAAERLIELSEEQAVYHINLVRGAEKEVHSLAEKLITIKSVLDDAENRRFKNDHISIWLSKLERTSCEMEDVLDQWDYALLKHRFDVASLKQKVWSQLVPSSCLCFKKIVVRHEIATKILDVKSQLDEILKEKDQYGFVISQPTDQPLPKSWRDSTSFTVEQVHGRDFDTDTLVTKLVVDGGSIQVVSIVGVGGLGKTTIAQVVYNHTRLEKHFDLRIWVCVSDPFDLAAIAKGIIESVSKNDSPSTNNLEILWQSVAGFISGKKFLLVLDDVWTEEYGKWECLESYLRCGGAGSKILVTTRKTEVAKKIGTMDENIHYPEMLSLEDCWMLMRRIARLERGETEFEDIGKEIAKKCKGLPLAARTLGSLLRSKSTLAQWEVVLNSDIWEMKEAKVELFPHLLLSYNELSPTDLKRCFSYCAVYPKDSIIDVQELIQNWSALGYLGNDSSDTEDRGRKYFDILAMHSLFQEIDEDEASGRIHCKMHDIVHDFAQFLNKRVRVGETSTNKCTTCQSDPSQISTVNQFRSLFWNEKRSSPNFCDCLTSLRVLSLKKCNLQGIPQIMENFIHLRLLNLNGSELSHDDLKIVFKLYNLKTLNLGSCNLKEIPAEIGNLIRLRNLDLSKNIFLEKLPKEMENMVHLRNLNLRRNVSLNELPREFGCLVNLTHLNLGTNYFRKELPMEIGVLIHLTHLDLYMNESLTELPKEIGNLTHLTHLDLSSNHNLMKLPREIGNLVHLKHLNLSDNRSLSELPMEIGNLIHLTHLNLSSTFLTKLPREIGNLIHLTHLDLSWSDTLMELPREFGNLIHLRHLDLSENELEKLPETIRDLQELRFLDVTGSSRLCGVPERLAELTSLSSLTKFEGGSTWSKLGLLKNLTHLGKFVSLIIESNGDNDSESVVEDAQEAGLRNKIHIEDLTISFDRKVESSCSSRVIDALEPHPNLQRLDICDYKGSKLPRWIVSPLNQLKEVNLIACHHVTVLPSLGKLPCLGQIFIDEMEELEIVGREFLGFDECSSDTSLISFPNLRSLFFNGCKKLKEWEDITAEEEASTTLSVLPHLTQLLIMSCDGLTGLPHRLLHKAASLEKLDITGSKQLQERYGDKEGSDWKSISQNNPRLKLTYDQDEDDV